MPVEAIGLEASLGGKQVLRGATLSAGAGEIHVILGRNGAGKTTLIKAIAGLLKPARGKVLVDGVDVTGLEPSRRRLGVVLQGAPLLPVPTVLDHIMLPLKARGAPVGDAAREARRVAELLGITGLLDRRPWRLSGGERQRVAIATALASGARNLLLDEPFSSLDPGYRQGLYTLLHRLRSEGYTIIVATHVMDDLVYTSDMVWVMESGAIVDSGPPWELASSSGPGARLLKPPMTATIDCGSSGICEMLGVEGGTVNVHYTMLRAVRSPGGLRLLGIAWFNGDRVGVVEVDGQVLYALVQDDLEPGDRVALIPVARVGARR